MAKFGLGGTIKAPKVAAKLGVAAAGPKARSQLASGQKVTAGAGKIIATPQMLPPQAVTAEANSAMVMPQDHPNSVTARTQISKGGQL